MDCSAWSALGQVSVSVPMEIGCLRPRLRHHCEWRVGLLTGVARKFVQVWSTVWVCRKTWGPQDGYQASGPTCGCRLGVFDCPLLPPCPCPILPNAPGQCKLAQVWAPVWTCGKIGACRMGAMFRTHLAEVDAGCSTPPLLSPCPSPMLPNAAWRRKLVQVRAPVWTCRKVWGLQDWCEDCQLFSLLPSPMLPNAAGRRKLLQVWSPVWVCRESVGPAG
jgi:hypothetical protein